MSQRKHDVVVETFARFGVEVEKREGVDPLQQMIGSGLGGIAGTIVACSAGGGPITRALVSLTGAVAGHIFVTYRRADPEAAHLASAPPAGRDFRGEPFPRA